MLVLVSRQPRERLHAARPSGPSRMRNGFVDCDRPRRSSSLSAFRLSLLLFAPPLLSSQRHAADSPPISIQSSQQAWSLDDPRAEQCSHATTLDSQRTLRAVNSLHRHPPVMLPVWNGRAAEYALCTTHGTHPQQPRRIMQSSWRPLVGWPRRSHSAQSHPVPCRWPPSEKETSST